MSDAIQARLHRLYGFKGTEEILSMRKAIGTLFPSAKDAKLPAGSAPKAFVEALRESGDKMAAVKAVLEEELAASKGDRRRLNARVLY